MNMMQIVNADREFKTDTIRDLQIKYPELDYKTIYDIYFCGYDHHRAQINDRIIELFTGLKESDAEKYKEKIMRLYIDSFFVEGD